MKITANRKIKTDTVRSVPDDVLLGWEVGYFVGEKKMMPFVFAFYVVGAVLLEYSLQRCASPSLQVHGVQHTTPLQLQLCSVVIPYEAVWTTQYLTFFFVCFFFFSCFVVSTMAYRSRAFFILVSTFFSV